MKYQLNKATNARINWHGGFVVIMGIHGELNRVLELNLQSETQTHGVACCERENSMGEGIILCL